MYSSKRVCFTVHEEIISLGNSDSSFNFMVSSLLSLIHFILGLENRAVAEEKMKKIQEALDEVQTTHIREVDEMNEQLERQRERTEELTEAVSYSNDAEGFVLNTCAVPHSPFKNSSWQCYRAFFYKVNVWWYCPALS